ncbi:MAG: cation transporter, partial [Acidimicrobiales bacterium]
MTRTKTAQLQTAVLKVQGMQFASEQGKVAECLSCHHGVANVEVNAVAQTATVRFDPTQVSVEQLEGVVVDAGYNCPGQATPRHLCAPSAEDAGHGEADNPSPHAVMGHGSRGEMSMEDMVTDMRNRLLVAFVFTIPVVLYSTLGRDVLNFSTDAPFGLRDDVFQLLASLPVVFWASSIFFQGAVAALRRRTLDMMVLVSVAIAAGWIYSLVITLTGGGEVFYEAAAMLAVFVLLGHWFGMRARGGANDAIRAL